MQIGIYSDKGGVGKTPLAYFLALQKDATVVTNDESIISKYKKTYFVKNIEFFEADENNKNIIYDFGGWIEDSVLELLKKLDYVIIPFVYKVSSIEKTNELIKILDEHNIKTIKILTQIDKNKFEKNKKQIEKIMNFNIDFVLFESEIFEYIALTETKLQNLTKTQTRWWRNTIPTLNKLLKKLK